MEGRTMVSIYDWFGYEVPIRERYKLIKEVRFDAVLLWWSDGFGRGAGYREGVKLARSAGLFIENIHTPVQQQNDLSLDNLAGGRLNWIFKMSCQIHSMECHTPLGTMTVGKTAMHTQCCIQSTYWLTSFTRIDNEGFSIYYFFWSIIKHYTSPPNLPTSVA